MSFELPHLTVGAAVAEEDELRAAPPHGGGGSGCAGAPPSSLMECGSGVIIRAIRGRQVARCEWLGRLARGECVTPRTGACHTPD